MTIWMLEPVFMMEDMIELAEDNAWLPDGSNVGAVGIPPQIAWKTAKDQTRIVWLEDTLTRLPWILIEGNSEQAIANLIQKKIHIIDCETALCAWDSAKNDIERETALGWATIIAFLGENHKVIEVFRKAANYNKNFALLSTKYASRAVWNETIAFLAELEERSLDLEVKKNASIVSDWIKGKLAEKA